MSIRTQTKIKRWGLSHPPPRTDSFSTLNFKHQTPKYKLPCPPFTLAGRNFAKTPMFSRQKRSEWKRAPPLSPSYPPRVSLPIAYSWTVPIAAFCRGLTHPQRHELSARTFTHSLSSAWRLLLLVLCGSLRFRLACRLGPRAHCLNSLINPDSFCAMQLTQLKWKRAPPLSPPAFIP